VNCEQTGYKLTTEGCMAYCQNCDKAWGASKGCDSDVDHDVIDTVQNCNEAWGASEGCDPSVDHDITVE